MEEQRNCTNSRVWDIGIEPHRQGVYHWFLLELEYSVSTAPKQNLFELFYGVLWVPKTNGIVLGVIDMHEHIEDCWLATFIGQNMEK